MDYSYEQELINCGYQVVVGVDEAGRGAWAGPIVAGAVILGDNFIEKCEDWPCEIKNSKALSLKKRELLYDYIKEHALYSGAGIVDSTELDKIGLQKANFLCIERAIDSLGVDVSYVLADYVGGLQLTCGFQSLKKGDETILSIACASIIAKVTRDRIMNELSTAYPQYGFDGHVGYGTKKHRECIYEHGLCDIHRKSFNINT